MKATWQDRWNFFRLPIPHDGQCDGKWEGCRPVRMFIDDHLWVNFPYCRWAFNRHCFNNCREAIEMWLEEAFGPIASHTGGLAKEKRRNPDGESCLQYGGGNQWMVFAPVGHVPPTDLLPAGRTRRTWTYFIQGRSTGSAVRRAPCAW